MVKPLLLILLLAISTSSLAVTEKIVYHLHVSGNNHFNLTVTNLENLQKGMPDKNLDIKLLLQGGGIHLLNNSFLSDQLITRFEQLRNNGVSVEVGLNNYQQNRHLLEQTRQPSIVNNIFSRIIELQNQGYKYITP